MKIKQKKTILPKTPSATSTNSQLRLLPSQNIIFYKLNKGKKETIRIQLLLRLWSPAWAGPTLSGFEHSFHRFSAFRFRLVSILPLAKLNSLFTQMHSTPERKSRFLSWQHFSVSCTNTHTRAPIVQPQNDVTAIHQSKRRHVSANAIEKKKKTTSTTCKLQS